MNLNRNAHLADLLLYPQEDLDKEFKGWLDLTNDDDKASLAQALLALANHGGGYIVLGYRPKPLEPDIRTGQTVAIYSDDNVNGIVEKYADPSFQCNVELVTHPANAQQFPIIRVPGIHKVPIRAKRSGPNEKHVQKDKYYIRRPGPKSEPPQTAAEWSELINRCVLNNREEMLDTIRSILLGVPLPGNVPVEITKQDALNEWVSESEKRWTEVVAERLKNESPSRFRNGYFTVAYTVLNLDTTANLPEFLEQLRRAKGNESGWPPWWVPNSEGLEPYTATDDIWECWIGKGPMEGDACHSDFWRARTDATLFLRSGYQEDSREGQPPGSALRYSSPIWLMGQCLLHAARLSTAIVKNDPLVLFTIRWDGLTNRRLWRDDDSDIPPAYISKRSSFSSGTMEFSARSIFENLPEILVPVITKLFGAFNYFPDENHVHKFVTQEIQKMSGKTFR